MIISVSNRKGGTGKTTISFNLGITFGLQKKKILFIDLDSQGNLSMLSKVNAISIDDFKELNILELSEYIHILPASKQFNILENEISNLVNRNTWLLKNIIGKVQGKYDFIIIDTPPNLSILNINAFCGSDLLLIPVNPDGFSISGLNEMKNIYNEIVEVNPKLEYKIILNAFLSNRKVFENLKPLLEKEKNYTGIEIPLREYINQCSVLKKPALENEDIKKSFYNLAEMIGVVKV